VLNPDTVATLTAGNFGTLTTLRPDGHPATQVMWVDADDEFVLINTEKHRRKFAHMMADPRVTVTVWDREDPYKYLEIRGVVEDVVDGPAAREHIEKLSWRYFGRPYDESIILSERVILRIRPLNPKL
jgi:PPOX class probable F420-dependent enzyme